MNHFLFLCLLTLFLNSGCNIFCVSGNEEMIQTSRVLNEFHEIETDGNFEVYIKKSNTHAAIVEAESNLQPEIVTIIKDGKLIIKSKECINPTSDIKIYVSVNNLEAIALNGSGNIHCNDTFQSDKFSIKINGAGDIIAFIKTGSLEAVLNGSGDILLAGKASLTDLKINGAGDINAFGLYTKETKVKINGAGSAEIYADVAIDAAISGSGDVNYKGKNPQIKSKITGSGDVIKKTK